MRDQLAVIWDMDGVLIDSGAAHFLAWQALAGELGRAVTAEDFRLTFGMRNEEVVATLFGDLDFAEAGDLIERKERHFRQAVRAGRVSTLPGARELLDELRSAGCRQAVASSAPPINVQVSLDTLELGSYFDALVTGADVRIGKPHPEVFLLAARALDTRPDRCVVLEDSVVGVQAARSAGAACVGLVGANTASQLALADLVVTSLDELSPAVLGRLLSTARWGER